jgi:hypothetical protein
MKVATTDRAAVLIEYSLCARRTVRNDVAVSWPKKKLSNRTKSVVLILVTEMLGDQPGIMARTSIRTVHLPLIITEMLTVDLPNKMLAIVWGSPFPSATTDVQ